SLGRWPVGRDVRRAALARVSDEDLLAPDIDRPGLPFAVQQLRPGQRASREQGGRGPGQRLIFGRIAVDADHRNPAPLTGARAPDPAELADRPGEVAVPAGLEQQRRTDRAKAHRRSQPLRPGQPRWPELYRREPGPRLSR